MLPENESRRWVDLLMRSEVDAECAREAVHSACGLLLLVLGRWRLAGVGSAVCADPDLPACGLCQSERRRV